MRVPAAAAALALAAWGGAGGAAAQSTYEQLQTFSGVLGHIRLNYVDSVGTAHLVRAAITGMLASLDPHSHFQSLDEIQRLMSWRAGRFAATGVLVEPVDGAIVVLTVYPGSPAARAGVSAGDRVVEVNDTNVAGLSASAVQSRLVGERGTRVRLLLERGSRHEPESVLVRLRNEYVRPRAVTVARPLARGIGYVRLEEFLPSSGDELHDAIGRALRGGRNGLVLDLRGNPGGDVEAAVEVASEFLARGQLVARSRGRRREMDRSYLTARDGEYRNLPLIVLIDERSASAAEMVAGALQDHDRALVVGRRSFGKALIQRVFEVPPGGDAVWLTVGHILTPSGRVIQRRYRGLNAAQYYGLAGRAGAAEDTSAAYRTGRGRLVRGGGGILPDSTIPGPPALPPWYSAAADTGLDHSVADSVAALLPADDRSREAWMDATAQWQSRLVEPFLGRVRAELGIRAEADSALRAVIGRILAARVAQVRWGAEGLDEFRVRNDQDIRSAMGMWPELPRMLGPAGPTEAPRQDP